MGIVGGSLLQAMTIAMAGYFSLGKIHQLTLVRSSRNDVNGYVEAVAESI
jgi:hypothetical protein